MADDDGGSCTLRTRMGRCRENAPADGKAVEYWTATPVLVQGFAPMAYPQQTDQKGAVIITTQVWPTGWHSFADIKIERATYCARVLTPSWDTFAQSKVRAMDKDACVRIIGEEAFEGYLPC